MPGKLNGPALSRAVDWKIFEIQSRLVSEEADENDIRECKEWFQARHYNEVVEERAADSRCGYPLCNKHLILNNNQQFRINYNEKEIYKVENSLFYCSNECLLTSILLEKSFPTDMPSSRLVTRTLDADSVKANINDLLDLFDDNTPKESKKKVSSTSDPENEIPPEYYHKQLSEEGKIEATEKNEVDSIPIEKQSGLASQVTELLSKVDVRKKTFEPKKPDTSIKRDIIADAAVTSAATADLSVDDILNKMKAIRERKPVVPKPTIVSDGFDKLEGYTVEKSGILAKNNNKREQEWTEPSTVGDNKKSVKWQDSDGIRKSTTVKSDSITKLKVGERQPSAVKSVVPIMSKIGSVMERQNPQPMSVNAMMLKQEVPVVPMTGVQINASTGATISTVAPPGMDLSMNIEGYVANIRSVRVAPSTTIKNLSYDPFQRRSFADTERNDADVDVVEDTNAIEVLDDNSNSPDNEVETTDSDFEDEYDADEPTVSLFLSVWTALDDLFSDVRMDVDDNNLPPVPHSTSSSNDTNDGQFQQSRMPLATEFQQIQSAILKLLERGIKTAEKLLDVNKYVLSRSEVNVYYITKNRFLNSLNKRLTKCPSLKSSGWTLIGILLIDGILTRKGLLNSSYQGPVWTATVDSMAAAALGGGHIAGSLLRMDDLKILRSFLNDL